MINIFNTENGKIEKTDSITFGSWINLCAPTNEEVNYVSEALEVDSSLLYAALDEEERSHIDFEDGDMLVLVDTPIVEKQTGGSGAYSTIPFGIILTKFNIITVCLKENDLAKAFYESTIKDISSKKKNKMTLQLLYKNSTLFLYYLKEVDKASQIVENELHLSMKNKELIQMLGLEKSLVYFSTSLRSNEIVLEKLLRMDFVRNYPDDTELLEDVIIENKQAIEMANIYRNILSGTMDAFASIISNNLNMVMKLLASLTIILTIPTIIFGLFGTNVPLPWGDSPFGFAIVILIAIIFTVGSVILMKIKKWM